MLTPVFVPAGFAQIFDNPQNLQVLPKDISPQELGDTMKGFALGTGNRCSTCHVGEEGQPLTSYDFSNDEKEMKIKARAMLKMVNDINSNHLQDMGESRLKVGCVTCHRGLNKPWLTADTLNNAADEGGADKMVEEYAALRERYYGTHSYDFSEFTLSEIVKTRSGAGHNDQARALLDLMLEENQQSFMAHFLYGQIDDEDRNNESAIGHYEKAMEINPRSKRFIDPRLEKLRGPSE
jgi:tetratricopeptide (TPR) repeat protein